MRRSRLALSLAVAAGGAYAIKTVAAGRIRSWATNPDATDGDPLTMPEGTPIETTADDGAVLRGLDCGEGPAVLLVHCWTGNLHYWAPVARRLVDAGFRVVAPDQRGHGTSDRGTAPFAPETLGADLRRWIDSLDLEDVVLAGHSMGGLASMAYVCDHGEHAHERVRGLVLVATLASPVKNPRLPDIDVDVARLLPLVDRIMKPVDYGLFSLLGLHGTRPARAQLEATRVGFLGTDPAVRSEAVQMMQRFDLRPRLADIAIATQVIAGSHDQLTPLPGNEAIAHAIGGSHIEVLPGSGHMLPWEAPDQVTEAIIQAAKPA